MCYLKLIKACEKDIIVYTSGHYIHIICIVSEDLADCILIYVFFEEN